MHPYIEWFSRGEGSRLIQSFFRDRTLESFKAIYNDISKNTKQNPDFIPAEFRDYVGSTLVNIRFGELKDQIIEKHAVLAIAALGDLAADITDDNRWAVSSKGVLESYDTCKNWYLQIIGD